MNVKELNSSIKRAEDFILKMYATNGTAKNTNRVYVNGDTINLVDNIPTSEIEATEGYVFKVAYKALNEKRQKEPTAYATLEKDFNNDTSKQRVTLYLPVERINMLDEFATKSNKSKSDIIASLILELKPQ